MILNNAFNAPTTFEVKGANGSSIVVIKSPESWGTITPPGTMPYSVTVNGQTAGNINNPDACVTWVDGKIAVTYPGA